MRLSLFLLKHFISRVNVNCRSFFKNRVKYVTSRCSLKASSTRVRVLHYIPVYKYILQYPRLCILYHITGYVKVADSRGYLFLRSSECHFKKVKPQFLSGQVLLKCGFSVTINYIKSLSNCNIPAILYLNS